MGICGKSRWVCLLMRRLTRRMGMSKRCGFVAFYHPNGFSGTFEREMMKLSSSDCTEPDDFYEKMQVGPAGLCVGDTVASCPLGRAIFMFKCVDIKDQR